ncbi:MAG: oligosaccharide flippase family protein [Verrucomicrobiota bacterium]
MNRKSLLARGVLLGYGALAVQIFYSIASIPLALSYLSHAEFGMWGLVTTLVNYLGLIEVGMTNGFQRHLFDCKEDKNDGRYGRLFTASLVALGLAAAIVLVIGLIGIWAAIPIYRIPPELKDRFVWVMVAQVLLSSASMATRMLGSPLYIHQRHDLMQVCQIILFFIYYGVLHMGFHAGWGLYAMIANTVAGFIWVLIFNTVACKKLKFYPPAGTWGWPNPDEFKSVFRYSRDIFLVQVGNQFRSGLPMLLLPRFLGLDAAATWTVCTRTFTILTQIVSKPYDYGLPMLCEIYARGEESKMAKRWTEITQLVLALSVCVFAVGAANNGHFVRVWVGGQLAWASATDWWIALSCIVAAIAAAAFGIVGFHKQMGFIRFVPLLESALIGFNAWWMVGRWGVVGLIVATMASSLFGSIGFGIHHLATITRTPVSKLIHEALWRPLRVLPLTAILAWASSYFGNLLPGFAGLLLSAGIGSLLAGSVTVLFGVSTDVRNELFQLLRRVIKRSRGSTSLLQAEEALTR